MDRAPRQATTRSRIDSLFSAASAPDPAVQRYIRLGTRASPERAGQPPRRRVEYCRRLGAMPRLRPTADFSPRGNGASDFPPRRSRRLGTGVSTPSGRGSGRGSGCFATGISSSSTCSIDGGARIRAQQPTRTRGPGRHNEGLRRRRTAARRAHARRRGKRSADHVDDASSRSATSHPISRPTSPPAPHGARATGSEGLVARAAGELLGALVQLPGYYQLALREHVLQRLEPALVIAPAGILDGMS